MACVLLISFRNHKSHYCRFRFPDRMLGCMCYYGHCQNTAHLGSNMFTSYLLGAAVEIPSWSAPWLINRLGRRLPLTVLFLLSGGASVLYALVPLGQFRPQCSLLSFSF